MNIKLANNRFLIKIEIFFSLIGAILAKKLLTMSNPVLNIIINILNININLKKNKYKYDVVWIIIIATIRCMTELN